jgi:Protein of unknown function (DUF4232)
MKVRVIGVLAAVAVGGLTLGACSSGSPSSSTTTTSSSSSTSSSTSAPTTTAPPASTTSTTAAAGPARCASASLVGTVEGSSGAAGTIETTIALRSTATTSCVLGGYPGLQMVSATGTNLPTVVTRMGTYSFTAMAPTTVTLAPGQTAYFNIGYSDVPVGSETNCPTSGSLLVTPPNAFDHLTVSAMLAPCGGGSLTVSPVFSATGANTQSTAG